jgi:hypothetical protein
MAIPWQSLVKRVCSIPPEVEVAPPKIPWIDGREMRRCLFFCFADEIAPKGNAEKGGGDQEGDRAAVGGG